MYRDLSYDREHDACGIGAVVKIDGRPEYSVMDDALSIVEKLEHRAGKDATGTVGDGVGILLQFLDRTYMIECFFSAVVLLILYITIERPGDYMDSATGLQNDYAFYVNAAIRIKRRRGTRMVAVSLDNIDFLDSSIGYETTSRLLILAAESMEKISKELIFTAMLARAGAATILMAREITVPRKEKNTPIPKARWA